MAKNKPKEDLPLMEASSMYILTGEGSTNEEALNDLKRSMIDFIFNVVEKNDVASEVVFRELGRDAFPDLGEEIENIPIGY